MQTSRKCATGRSRDSRPRRNTEFLPNHAGIEGYKSQANLEINLARLVMGTRKFLQVKKEQTEDTIPLLNEAGDLMTKDTGNAKAPNDLNDGTDCTLSKFADDRNWE